MIDFCSVLDRITRNHPLFTERHVIALCTCPIVLHHPQRPNHGNSPHSDGVTRLTCLTRTAFRAMLSERELLCNPGNFPAGLTQIMSPCLKVFWNRAMSDIIFHAFVFFLHASVMCASFFFFSNDYLAVSDSEQGQCLFDKTWRNYLFLRWCCLFWRQVLSGSKHICEHNLCAADN